MTDPVAHTDEGVAKAYLYFVSGAAACLGACVSSHQLWGALVSGLVFAALYLNAFRFFTRGPK